MSPLVREQSYRFETLVRSPRQQALGALRASPDLGSVRRMNALGVLAEKATLESPSVPRGLAKDVRGAIMLEYVVVLLLVSGVACAAIVLLGMAMARFYMSQEAWLAIPFP